MRVFMPAPVCDTLNNKYPVQVSEPALPMNGNIREKIIAIVSRVAEEHGVDVADVELLGQGKLLLRVFIDKEGGVTLGDCELFSKSLSAVLDVEDPVPGRFTLEVSSPGLDRPLKSLKDFEKNKGKLARIVTMEKIENQNFIVGRIGEITNGSITLLVNDRPVGIPFGKITKARLEIEL
jgi:ribosome maturation factor RimP